jgi:hypothetical protein
MIFFSNHSHIQSFKDNWEGTWSPKLEQNQVCWANLQCINRWSPFSIASKQSGHIVSKLTSFLCSLHLVRRIPLASLQRNFDTLRSLNLPNHIYLVHNSLQYIGIKFYSHNSLRFVVHSNILIDKLWIRKFIFWLSPPV